jgi:integrase
MAAHMERVKNNPGIYRRGSRYVVVWQHKGRQHKGFFRTLAEAREAKGQRQAGDRTPVTRQPFEDYARQWLDGYQGRTSRGFSNTSREDYKRALEHHAIPFFRGWRLADVEPPDVRRLVRELEGKGLSSASVLKNLVPLKAMFATAVEDGALRANPTAGVRVNRRRDDAEEEVEAKAMTRAQLAAVLAETPDEWRLFLELLAHTGLRISEALGLDWSDVELGKRPRLRVRRQFYRGTLKQLKTRAGRRDLPLSQDMSRKLWAARPARGEGPMFATRHGTRYSDRNIRRVLDGVTERAGVPWAGFHTFRHTCASVLFESGKNIRQVSEWLGHSDPSFTLRTYVHLMDAGLGDADFLDEAVHVGKVGARQDPDTAEIGETLSAVETGA